MAQKELNLGILAHVDAGKTTLTERLLYEAGVIRHMGSVDAGTTQTDSLPLEQARGITIRSAVTSFALGDVHVNLIDTPGHPDFIAEVERVLGVLDGAVLVISAVEGVQPQTRILMRVLKRLSIPTLIFINKIDRPGAADDRVLRAVAARLTEAVVPMGAPQELGTRTASFAPWRADVLEFRSRLAEVLAERDDRIMAAYVEKPLLPYSELRAALAAQTKQAVLHPVFFGSATTGAGVASLMEAIPELLPASDGDSDGPLAATVFKIERGAQGEKITFARVFSGTIRTREWVHLGAGRDERVTAIAVFEQGQAVQRPSVCAGGVAKLWGLAESRIGDHLGDSTTDGASRQFPPPTLESVVVSRRSEHRARLHDALAQLAEQDPLIDVRQDDIRHELSVSLYGEVQREVIEATLANDYGVEATFREPTTIHIERPVGTGEALEILYAKTKTNVTGKSSPRSANPFPATLGLRVDPAPEGSGVELRLDFDGRLVPLYIYKTSGGFTEHIQRYVEETLEQGLSGWHVTDCVVTVTDCGYQAPGTTAGDFRKLTPLVLMRALEQAGTVACEPMLELSLDIPTVTTGAVMPVLARLGATFDTQSAERELTVVRTLMPAARAEELRRQLPGLTSGEGVIETAFAGYRPTTAGRPRRRRTTPNPLNVDEYMLHLARRSRRLAHDEASQL